jgi:hypothetical protein
MKEGRSADEQMKRQQGRDETVESHLKALAERDLADTARLKAFEEDLGTQISSLLRSQEDLAQRADLSGTERLTGAREALSRFEESWRASLAMKLLFDGRFSDIEAVKNTWERAVKEVRAKAAQDQKNTPEEFEKVRAKFWEILNAPERSTNEREARDVHEVRRLLDLARVEWQSGSSAPLLKMQSESVDRIREASRRGDAQAQRWERDMDRNLLLSIDHVADKNTHRELTQDAANLRLMAVPDNSARGAWFDVSDRRKADFLRPETQQVRNDKRRDTARRQSADRSQDELQAKEIMLAPERLRQDQHRAQTAHDRAMLAAKDRNDLKLTELRDASLNKLDDESEAAHLARRENLLDVLERFQRSSREQLETLKTYEAGVHERQHQDLGKALATLDAASTFSDAARQLGSITKRLAEERRGVEALWGEMARQQSQNEALLLQAIYGARSREVQEEQLERAVAEQEKTRSFLQARLDEAKRNERMDD